jgi:hypothetical protein
MTRENFAKIKTPHIVSQPVNNSSQEKKQPYMKMWGFFMPKI